MTPSEIIQKDKELLKGLPLRAKAVHLWHYYKWYTLALLMVVLYIISTIIAYIDTSNCILNGYFLNVTGSPYSLAELSENYLPADSDETVYIDTMLFTSDPSAENASSIYENFQNLIAKAHAGDLDFVVVDDEAINQLIYSEFFPDLTTFLTQEQLSVYAGRLLYMDREFLENIRNLDASTDLTTPIWYPDPADPESMGDPIPVLIDIRDSRWMAELYPDDTELHAFGLVTNGQHHDTALDFLDFLLSGAEAS